jgi:hypothetical protein
MIDYLQRDQTIIMEYKTSPKKAMKEKCQGKLYADVPLLQDNAAVHKAEAALAATANGRFERLPRTWPHPTF